MPAGRRGDGAGSGGGGIAEEGAPGQALRSRRPPPMQRTSGTGMTMLAWGVLVLLACRGGAEACPAPCSCLGSTVDCHGLGIRSVPKNVPRGTERL